MLRTCRLRAIPSIARNSTTILRSRYFSTTMAHLRKPNAGPPAHEMVYFPQMTTSLPSESAEFRRVLWTGLYSQLVLMTVPVGGDIGDEVHTVDQVLTFTSGTGRATVAGKDQDVKAGDLVIVPAGTQHQFINTGPTPLVRRTPFRGSCVILTVSCCRYCTRSTLRQSTSQRLFIKRKTKETKRKMTGLTCLPSGAKDLRMKTRRLALLPEAGEGSLHSLTPSR
jgi:mannose-6-phosphate isomerase-like protein (cupin superfamily)